MSPFWLFGARYFGNSPYSLPSILCVFKRWRRNVDDALWLIYPHWQTTWKISWNQDTPPDGNLLTNWHTENSPNTPARAVTRKKTKTKRKKTWDFYPMKAKRMDWWTHRSFWDTTYWDPMNRTSEVDLKTNSTLVYWRQRVCCCLHCFSSWWWYMSTYISEEFGVTCKLAINPLFPLLFSIYFLGGWQVDFV